MTHDDLVYAAHWWLKGSQGHKVVVSECGSAVAEIPDVIGWINGYSTIIECKVSRADFLADAGKAFRRYPALGALAQNCQGSLK